MSIQVIGTGFGRTGTLSLKNALEKLGLSRCYHMMEVFQNPHHIDHWMQAARSGAIEWQTVFADYEACVDWPAAAYWQELGKVFPEAKFIHTERDEQDWYRSFQDTIQIPATEPVDGVPPGWSEMAIATINDRVFGGRGKIREACLDAYRSNNKRVRELIPADRLLVFNPRDGWGPLCKFLDVEVPEEPYPHDNSTADFRARENST